MKHPNTRFERRHQRERIINKRKFIYQHIWKINPIWYTDFGRFNKWNLTCDCHLCKLERIYEEKEKRKHERKLKFDYINWELEY